MYVRLSCSFFKRFSGREWDKKERHLSYPEKLNKACIRKQTRLETLCERQIFHISFITINN